MARQKPEWLQVACPKCKRPAGKYCRTAEGRHLHSPHIARTRALNLWKIQAHKLKCNLQTF